MAVTPKAQIADFAFMQAPYDLKLPFFHLDSKMQAAERNGELGNNLK